MDFRQVGNAMRRRFGAPSSHLGMVEESTMGKGSRIPGVSDVKYSTGSGAQGAERGFMSGQTTDFASSVSASQQNEPHAPRGRGVAGGGARLTVSPSYKNAETSPAPTQGAGRRVSSGRGRSMGNFDRGMQEVYDA